MTAMATNMAPAKACLLMDWLLLFVTTAATYPAKKVVMGGLFGIAEAIAMAPTKNKKEQWQWQLTRILQKLLRQIVCC